MKTILRFRPVVSRCGRERQRSRGPVGGEDAAPDLAGSAVNRLHFCFDA